jgi:RHS repeat-associated protein
LTLTTAYDFDGHFPSVLYRVSTVIAALDNAPTDLAPASKDDSFSYVHGPGIDDHRSRGRLGGDCHRQPAGRDERERTSQWITELGPYDYRNRVYSAELGRFLQTDPIQFDAGDVNLYRYVSNNSTRWIDPNGLEKRDCFHTVLAGHGDHLQPNRPAPEACGDAYGQVSCYGDRWNDAMVAIGKGIPGLPRNNRGELLELDGTPFGNNANRHLRRAWKAAIAHAKKTCRDKSSCCRSVTVTLECDEGMEKLSRNPITRMSAPGDSLCGQRKTIQCGN